MAVEAAVCGSAVVVSTEEFMVVPTDVCDRVQQRATVCDSTSGSVQHQCAW